MRHRGCCVDPRAPSGVPPAARARGTRHRASNPDTRGQMSDSLFAFDRSQGVRYVCGADEAGRACMAGPLVAAAVRLDHERLGVDAEARLADLNDSKKL